MNRNLLFGSICVFGFSSLIAADEPARPMPKSAEAQKAQATFEAELKKIDEEHAAKLKALREQYVKELEQARKAALEKNDLDETQRILTLRKIVELETKAGVVPARGLDIIKCKYGAKSSWLDVTASIRKHIRDGKQSIIPEMDLQDPIFGTFKSLLIVYSMNGKIDVSVHNQNERITLPARK